MSDDGNRQVALTVEQIAVAVGLNPTQFQTLVDLAAQQDLQLGAINGAINKLAENVSEPDTNLATEISLLKHVINDGFSGLQQSIANLNNVIFERSVDLAKWLAAIALAAANPADNTAEIQKLIDAQAAKLDSDATAINDALNQVNQKKEN